MLNYEACETKRKKGGKRFDALENQTAGSFLFFLSPAQFFLRLYTLQVRAYDSYRFLAENQHNIQEILNARRGEIFLKDEGSLYPLAVNKNFPMLFAVPKEIVDAEKVSYQIAEIIGVNREEALAKLSKKEDLYEVLKHKLSDQEVDKIKSQKIPGVYISDEYLRFYPGGDIASQVVGFVGSDGNTFSGRYGLEAYWNEELKGVAGKMKQEKDAAGRWISISERDITPARDGDDLVLTINHTVQFEVEKILKEAIERHSADNGSVIVMEPSTGKILAMANYPNFNPNEFSKVEDMSAFSNSTVSQPFEPGSVFKAITLAMGIDTGMINPNSPFVDTGTVREGGYSIKNAEEKVYGKVTMTDVLSQSINTGTIFTEKLVGNARFAEYVKKFGFGDRTGIELPGEQKGSIRNLEVLKRNIQFFTASFGQGITTTPIQLISAYSALANKGVLMKPQIVDEIRHSDGSVDKKEPEAVRQAVSESTAQQMGIMLRDVVVNGHGKRADVPGYLVGGKTGTAQVAKSDGPGYEDNLTIGSFIGYAPVNDPRFAVLVKINNPKDVEWAESTAAPTFGQVMKFLLDYYHVKPNTEEELDIVKKK